MKLDLTSILTDLGAVASKVSSVIGGGGEIGAVVGLGHAVISAISAAKAIHSGAVPAAAAAGEADLLKSVTAHAQSTFDRAEGKS